MKYIVLLYIISNLTNMCLMTMFKLEDYKQENLPVCKLIKIRNVGYEIKCGKECKMDTECVHFSYDNRTKECLMCTAGDISSLKSQFTYIPHSEKSLQRVYNNMDGCRTVGLCPPRDCSDYRRQGYYTSGIYNVTPSTGHTFPVYCDMDTDGGGWTVLQRRVDGSEDFYRTWAEYEAGFGNLNEFWLGNANISAITTQGTYQMRIDMSDLDWTNVYIVYDDFNLDSNDYYKLSYSTYKGNIADSLCPSAARCANGKRFSAKDRDLDSSTDSCALIYKGAWWYASCHQSNLNGLYLNGTYTTFATGMSWYAFHGQYYSLRYTEMKIRPTTYKQPYKLYQYETDLPAARDCADHRDRGITTSGIYSITSRGRTPMTLNVYCDMDTNGGGWLVLQRRMDGSVNFTKNWIEFQNGFGSLSTEFWLGNEKISDITDQGSYEMRVDMEDFDGNKRYASYNFFTINRNNKYRLLIGKYSGNAGDSLAHQNGTKWTTYDNDNDEYSTNCAEMYKGAWWHKDCHHSNLNGLYLNGTHTTFAVGVNWKAFKGYHYSLKFTDMKIRPAGYNPPQ